MSTAISATIGVAALCAAAVQPWTRFSALWPDWWLGDAFGALVVAPGDSDDRPYAGRVVATRVGRDVSTRDWRCGGQPGCLRLRSSSRLCTASARCDPFLRFVITAAVRLGQPAAALVVLGASAVTIWNTVRGAGPFAVSDVQQSLFLLQAFMAVLAFTGLLLAAAIAERRTSERTRRGRVRGRRRPDRCAESFSRGVGDSASRVRPNLGWRVSALWLIDHDLQRLRCLTVWSDDAGPSTTAFGKATKETLFSSGVGLPGRVWATRKAAWIENVADDPNFPRASVAAKAGIRGAFAFPICLGGEVLGVIECFNRTVIAPIRPAPGRCRRSGATSGSSWAASVKKPPSWRHSDARAPSWIRRWTPSSA